MRKFKVGDPVRSIKCYNFLEECEGIVRAYQGDLVVVEFEREVQGGWDCGVGLGRRGRRGDEAQLVPILSGESMLNNHAKSTLAEIGDSILEKKGILPPAEIKIATEYRSSMVSSDAIKPSIQVRPGRPLYCTGVRIY